MDAVKEDRSEEYALHRGNVAPGAWTGRSSALLLCVLVVSTVLIVRGIHTGEFSYNVDETQHAVTGLFVADVLRDHPLAHPIDYVYQYYAQYPALSGLVHWPPLFYLFEGLCFLLLGPTVMAARLSVLFFALIGTIFWFLLIRELQNEWMAAAGALMLACLPSVLLFEKMVMLEIPCLALSLGAILFWTRYLLRQARGSVYWFAILASAALLTKQNAVFLIPFCLLSGLSVGGWKFFLRAAVLRAILICVVLIAPFYVLVYMVHWKTIAMDLGEHKVSAWYSSTVYWRALPEQLGWTLLLLALIGILMSWQWDRSRNVMLMMSWILACYGTFTLIGHKEPRYALYWVPPFLYFALGMLTTYFRPPVLKKAGVAVVLLVLANTLASGWSLHRPYVSGYEAAAASITASVSSGIILYDGPLPGNFIFFIRAHDPHRRFLVIRKALYAVKLKLGGGSVELLHNEADIEKFISTSGVRFVVASEGQAFHFGSQEVLRRMLAAPPFHLLRRFHISGTDLETPNLDLNVFENSAWTQPTDKYLRIKMLTLDHDIVVPMDRFRFDVEGASQSTTRGTEGGNQ